MSTGAGEWTMKSSIGWLPFPFPQAIRLKMNWTRYSIFLRKPNTYYTSDWRWTGQYIFKSKNKIFSPVKKPSSIFSLSQHNWVGFQFVTMQIIANYNDLQWFKKFQRNDRISQIFMRCSKCGLMVLLIDKRGGVIIYWGVMSCHELEGSCCQQVSHRLGVPLTVLACNRGLRAIITVVGRIVEVHVARDHTF